MAKVLVVECDVDAARPLQGWLSKAGHASQHVATVSEAIRALEQEVIELVIVELKLGSSSGTALLAQIVQRWPGLPVVMVAATSTVTEAVEAMRMGAADFLLKPLDSDAFSYVVNKVLTAAGSGDDTPSMRSANASTLVGQSDAMEQLRNMVQRAASGTATVLIRGESGTGKELVARAIHRGGARRDQPFVKIDCTSLPDSLLESELFGYEKGAFTGASTRKPGRVELAERGTVFFDEIGELSANMQAKLLRLLQDREFDKLGGKRTLRVDVRFVLATHRDLETMVANGAFREDLFYRMNVVPVWLPPLRARRDDIELLAKHFCSKFGQEAGRPATSLSPEALKLLRGQRWPGNVRQLENFIERLIVLSDASIIGIADVQRSLEFKPQFPTQTTGSGDTSAKSATPEPAPELARAVRKAERDALLLALERSGGNRSTAARALGVSRATLYNKLKELGIADR